MSPSCLEDPVREVRDLLLSAHRAGGIPEAFRTMGEMIVDDLELILNGLPPVRLQQARPEHGRSLLARAGTQVCERNNPLTPWPRPWGTRPMRAC